MKVKCECGSLIEKSNMNKHLKSKKHLNTLNLFDNKLDDTNDKTDDIKDDISEITDITDVTEVTENTEEVQEEPEVLEINAEDKIINQIDKKNYDKREHLNKIREKALEVIKQKKIQRIQAKIDKEMELKTKAELYDKLIEKQKLDEQERIRIDLENKEREKQKKIKDYDRLLEENLRMKTMQNKSISLHNIANHHLIDDIKKQKLEYLSRHLGISF